ncbi:MAG TPA: HAD-IIB family hydrolase [Sphaerochaeta sp.]|nr:HAD-IIB family hydrolase [Sphaerochaeta sp.]
MQVHGVFFCDVDGTLLPYGDQAIDERFFATVLEARQQGFLTVISSGRIYCSLYPLFIPVRDQVIFSASNGCLVLEHEEAILPPRTLRTEDIAPLIADLHSSGADVLISTVSGLFLLHERSEHELTLRYSNRAGIRFLHSPKELKEPVLQMTGLCRAPLEEVLGEIRKRWKSSYHINASGRQMFDIAPTHKGESLVAISEHLGVGREQTWAFGDNENDFLMLKAAGTAYLMEDAHPSLVRPSFLRTADVSTTIRSIVTEFRAKK